MSKISEKLKYLRETKGLIREAIEEQGGIIEDTTPFRKYADAIKNMPGEIGELESWRKVELPVTFTNPVYFGPDSDHVFVSEYSTSTSERESNGLWLYCYSTNTWTQLYDKLGGYICMTQADDGSYVFYPYTYSTSVTFDLISYNLETGEFKVVGTNLMLDSRYNAIAFEHGMIFEDTDVKISVWNKHLNQVVIQETPSTSQDCQTFGDYIIFNLGQETIKIGNVQTGVVSEMSGNALTTNTGYLTLVTLNEHMGLFSKTSSTTATDLLGLFLINGEAQTITRLYDLGYDWEHLEEFDNCYLLTSDVGHGILKITKNTYQLTAVTTSSSSYSYTDSLTTIDEGVVRLNGTTAICTNAEDKRTIALLDVNTLEWNVLYSYTGTSGVTRRIVRSDKMVIILGGQYDSVTAYAIHKNSTVITPNYVTSTEPVSSSRIYITDWGCAGSCSRYGTTRTVAFVVEGDSIKEHLFNDLWQVRTNFQSYNAAYYYNNNNDDPDEAWIIRIDKKDYSKCGGFKFAFSGTYYMHNMWQGANDTVYMMSINDILGIYDENTGNIKYYGDLGEHLPDYSADKTLPRWGEFSMLQAGPNHNYNWCTRGIIFCDEKDIQPQNTFNIGKVWRKYTYNNYYIEDIFSRRMLKMIPDEYDFQNYWMYDGSYDWVEQWFNFKAAISPKYMLICKDGEE